MGSSRKPVSKTCSNANTSCSGSGAKKHANWTRTPPCGHDPQYFVTILTKHNEVEMLDMLTYWVVAGGFVTGIAALGVAGLATEGIGLLPAGTILMTAAMNEISHGAIDVLYECQQCLGRCHATYECGFDGKFKHWGFYKKVKWTKSQTRLGFTHEALERIFNEMWDQHSYSWLSQNGKHWAAEFMAKLTGTTTNDDIANNNQQVQVVQVDLQNFQVPEGTNEQNQCTICLVGERQVVFDPCGHLGVCRRCSTRIGDNCPYCRQQIGKRLLVFHP